ncbi:glycosyltransferase family 2 protein [Loigolactobacillus bifermentans]|uniref:Glycosyltransferase 2-like domain-containing protein n=1 Tax=Loigolactobacillus bifermentans DSM 20003 TaxID=1423726 RepID=A0A0R1H051_9LACO|nr:glycosyltransferase family A protein [Loigolactobacillus bifermentans]KRK39958.1 hypothetical protein FC07_GL001856 [Loigolactobacillus bifermentans DSM 20003]QGG58973.1 glycosyltransferase [Loigolactobacillus bifermentans]QGG61759.1 glycosyltransferase [Loigolactobacillus bifermentans]
MNDVLLSIIIPIYNTQDTIIQLADNLKKLNFDDIEIVFVNDGSTDDSMKVLRYNFKDLHSNFKYKFLNKCNGGLSDARNFGLNNSNGKFVWFIDSDDLIDIKSVKIIYEFLSTHQTCDLLLFSYRLFESYSEINHTIDTDNGEFHYTNSEKLLTKLFLRQLDNYSWSFIACKSLYVQNNIQFPKGRNFEDYATTYKVFSKSKKPVVFSRITYFYRYRKESIVHSSVKLVGNAKDILFHSKVILKDLDNSLLARQFVFSFLLYAVNSLQQSRTNTSTRLVMVIDKKIRAFHTSDFPLKKKLIIISYRCSLYKIIKKWKLKNILLTTIDCFKHN